MTRDPTDLTPAQWEKKAEIAMMGGDFGKAMMYAHYANVADDEVDVPEEFENIV